MKVLDLFSGLGGFSQAFKDRGHEVITVDINPAFKPTICTDILKMDISVLGDGYDVILAAPPCTEFSRESMPWSKTGNEPDLSLVFKTIKIINRLKPRWWVVENVRGAIRYFDAIFGSHKRIGGRYFWGRFPLFYVPHDVAYGKEKLPPSPDRAAIRSKIEYEISLSLCKAIETWSMEVIQ